MDINYEEDEIRWIASAKRKGDKFVLVVEDTFSFDIFPIYCKDEIAKDVNFGKFNNVDMQRVLKVLTI